MNRYLLVGLLILNTVLLGVNGINLVMLRKTRAKFDAARQAYIDAAAKFDTLVCDCEGRSM